MLYCCTAVSIFSGPRSPRSLSSAPRLPVFRGLKVGASCTRLIHAQIYHAFLPLQEISRFRLIRLQERQRDSGTLTSEHKETCGAQVFRCYRLIKAREEGRKSLSKSYYYGTQDIAAWFWPCCSVFSWKSRVLFVKHPTHRG